jgi:hypothetical protein
MRIQDLTELTSLADTDLVVVDDYQSAGVYNTKKITVANLKSELGLPVKSIYLELTQSGTNAPTIQEVFNNTGVTVTSVYNGTGDYSIILGSNIMVSGKVVVTSTSGVIYPYILSIIRQNENQIDLSTYMSDGTYANFQLNNTGIKIEIYG